MTFFRLLLPTQNSLGFDAVDFIVLGLAILLCGLLLARERIRSLVLTAGGGPNTKQRQTIRDLLRDTPVPAAVVSDAPLVRGIVTALSWFNSAIRSFPFNQGAGLRDALKYLGIEGPMADRVVREVAEMQREVGNG